MQCQLRDAFEAAAHRVPAQLLYQTALSQPNSSLVISPFSILISLATLYLGTGYRSHTREELTDFLAESSKDDAEIVNRYAMSLREVKRSDAVQLFSGLYLDSAVDVNPYTVQVVQRAFQTSVKNVSFARNAVKAVKEINADVAAHTNNQIPRLLDDGAADSNAKMILVNTVRFKDEWAIKFTTKLTKPQRFFTAEGSQKKVPMMVGLESFLYSDADNTVTVLGMPYIAAARAIMYILLPKERYGLSDLLLALGNGDKCLKNLFDAVIYLDVNATIPKFDIESETNLLPILSNLSLGSLASNGADFILLSARESLSVDAFVQKAIISVTEDGTEAVAATAVQLGFRMISSEPPKLFVADHPFAYFIVAETPAGRQTLFSGVVADFPAQ